MRRNDLEHQHQVAVCQWWSWACKSYRLPEFALFAVPNGGMRSKATAGRLKAEGVRAGVPDLLLPVARHGFRGFALELKSESGRVSDAQKIVLPWFEAQCWRVEVAYTSEAAIGALKDYLAE